MSDEKQANDLNDINDEGEIFTLSDLLDQQREIDEDAAAVLGGSDENFCTYSQGYIKRQALYACLTCVPESREKPEKRAGVCLACSYKCHDGHELIELYTKRNFRCDCGTSKILAIRCKLEPNKMEDNDKNSYNHNFSGVYCTCDRPYPDPEDDVNDEMIQCIMCEDWFHSRHLNAKIPDSNGFDEMICDACTLNHDFLNLYSAYRIVPKDDANTSIESNADDTAAEISVTDVDETKSPGKEKPATEHIEAALDAEINQCIQDIIDINKKSNVLPETENGASSSSSLKRQNEQSDSDPSKKRLRLGDEPAAAAASGSSSSSSDTCRKPTVAEITFTGASFWPLEWREKLCKCTNCLKMYRDKNVEYLIDDEDTVHAYQEKGKAKSNDSTNQPLDQSILQNALSGMDRISQIEAILAYNKLKQKLTEFLTTFVANQQIITAKDVDTFFQTMSNEKKK